MVRSNEPVSLVVRLLFTASRQSVLVFIVAHLLLPVRKRKKIFCRFNEQVEGMKFCNTLGFGEKPLVGCQDPRVQARTQAHLFRLPHSSSSQTYLS
jgi:hypothetical protein